MDLTKRGDFIMKDYGLFINGEWSDFGLDKIGSEKPGNG